MKKIRVNSRVILEVFTKKKERVLKIKQILKKKIDSKQKTLRLNAQAPTVLVCSPPLMHITYLMVAHASPVLTPTSQSGTGFHVHFTLSKAQYSK